MRYEPTNLNKVVGDKSQVLGGGGRGLTSSHNKWGCAILIKKLIPKNPGTYLKLRPKNPGTRNARLSF